MGELWLRDADFEIRNSNRAHYWAQQDTNARKSQAFSNYQLDPTVIQDNNMYGNGTVGHGTVRNSTADALVRSDPNRYEIVDTPNFWKGVDDQEGSRENPSMTTSRGAISGENEAGCRRCLEFL